MPTSSGAVKRLGGTPAEAKAKYTFPVETLKTQNDVLRFAANLEKGAVSAYLGAVPTFKDRELAKAAASILGDEAMHWAVLRQAVGDDPVPAAFVS
jgi:rubrerythrin